MSGRWLIGALLSVILVLNGCSDGGVVIDNADSGSNPGSSSGGSSGSGNGDGTPTGGDLSEPDGGGPTGELPPVTSVSNLDPDDVEASRLLAQATFGATLADIATVKESGFEEWIDEQISLPVSLTEPYTRANSNGSSGAERHEVWWNNVLEQPDQLRQRVAFALSEIFVVSDLDYLLANNQWGMASYYDMLSRNAFGNYRDLLEDVTLHPVMGVFLSMVRNEKANVEENIRPDENYAREVLQLFSIGLYELNNRGEALPLASPVPAYSQDQVEEFARVFTGWNYDLVTSWETINLGGGDTFTTPMVPDERFHDTGSKNLLNGAVAPAGLNVREDMAFALDNIFQHANVGVLISKQLIQRLVTSNPTPDYVERVVTVFNDNGAGERGDLAAVVKAILLDDEARNGYLDNPDFGKLREPVVRLAHLWRALDGTPGPLADDVHNTPDFTLNRVDEMTGQEVMQAPSVFNFFDPDHPVVPSGTTLSPELQIMTEANLAATHNNYHHQVYRFNDRSDLSDDNPRVTVINLQPLVDLAADPDKLLDWYNLVLFGGSMPDTMRQTLFDYIGNLGSDDAGRFAAVQDSLFMLLVAPQYHLQR
ncbi:DUF1800 domain-containing protein [Granulosicoccus antarcticus]|nr:DUF1800 domain-containing protein [Granulosicoccus antarcticus]